METTDRHSAQHEGPIYYGADHEVIERYYAAQNPDPDEDDEEEESDDDAGDWGHVDPNEGNGPFPDPTDPSGPGSAV